jgi:hypothetical protein
MYSKIFLRLEPLGLELVAQAARQAPHEIRLIDLQVENQKEYFKLVDSWKPDVVGRLFDIQHAVLPMRLPLAQVL